MYCISAAGQHLRELVRNGAARTISQVALLHRIAGCLVALGSRLPYCTVLPYRTVLPYCTVLQVRGLLHQRLGGRRPPSPLSHLPHSRLPASRSPDRLPNRPPPSCLPVALSPSLEYRCLPFPYPGHPTPAPPFLTLHVSLQLFPPSRPVSVPRPPRVPAL